MIGEYVMTEQDCLLERETPEPIGMGSYNLDSHNVQRYVTPDGHVQNEGDVQQGGFPPYPISYRAVVPKRGQGPNLLVPVCFSASHIAFGSARMEPVFMVLAESVACAADLALRGGLDVQDVDYGKLRPMLEDAGQVRTP